MLQSRSPALLTQVLLINSVLIVGTLATASALTRVETTSPEGVRQVLVGLAAILATVLANSLVLRRRFAPLENLVSQIDAVTADDSELAADFKSADKRDPKDIRRLRSAFANLVARLHDEREKSAEAIVRAQEDERGRVARELHDEVNQALTGVLLRLQATSRNAPPGLRSELDETRQLAHQAMNELLRLARDLRPAALDDHGLLPALQARIGLLKDTAPFAVTFSADPDLPNLDPERQLVVFRAAQEALTNVMRHAKAAHVWIDLQRATGPDFTLCLSVSDDGVGLDAVSTSPGSGVGLAGMRERARLVGGTLTVQPRAPRGTVVELVL